MNDCEIKMSTEGFEILSSGSVIVPYNEYVQFEIKGMRFRFSFLQGTNEESASVHISRSVETISEGVECLSIMISNLEHAFFGSVRNSMHLATIEGRSLYVRFSITSVNINEEQHTEDKLLFYTWYLSNSGEEVEV